MLDAHSSVAAPAPTTFENLSPERITVISGALTRAAKSLVDSNCEQTRQAVKEKAAAFPTSLSLHVSRQELYRHGGHFAGFYGELYQLLGEGWICPETHCGVFLLEPAQRHFLDHGKMLPGNISTEIIAQAIGALFLVAFQEKGITPQLRHYNAKPHRPIQMEQLYTEIGPTTGYGLVDPAQRLFAAVTLATVSLPTKPGRPASVVGAGTIIGPQAGNWVSHHEAVISGAGLPNLQLEA